MVKAHAIMYIPNDFFYVGNDGLAYATSSYAKQADTLKEAVIHVVDSGIADYNSVANPYLPAPAYSTLSIDKDIKFSDSLKNFLANNAMRPLVLFLDYENQRIAGVVTGSEITFDNVVDMYRLFQNATYSNANGMYELTTKKGEKITFVTDEENGHLLVAENGELVPYHSLLDLVYVGFNAGILNRPYLRDWYDKVLRGYKDELIDVGLFALTAASTVTAIKYRKNKKVRNVSRGVAAVSGGYVGYRLYDRNKKIKEKQANTPSVNK